MEQTPIALYQDQVLKFQQEHQSWTASFNKWSAIRTIFFILSLIALVYFANERNYEVVVAIVFLFPLLFGILLRYHNKIRYQRDHALFLGQINKDEISRVEGRLKGFYPGNEYKDTKHPYTSDLDIFGDNSLFQLLNRTNTGPARDLLAQWLRLPSEPNIIQERQKAVKDLSVKMAWRQDFEASGRHFAEDQNHLSTLMQWIREPLLLKKKTLYLTSLIVMPALAVASILFWALADVSFYLPLFFLVVNLLILKTTFSAAAEITEKTSKSLKGLKAYEAMIRKIEEESFGADRLKTLQSNFSRKDLKASKEIKQLQVMVDNLQVRNNAYYWLVNGIFLLDIYWLLRLEKWKQQKEVDISIWQDSITEFEVLSSLAGFCYSNPLYAFPSISDKPHTLSAIGLGHPLLKHGQRVTNDFQMEGKIAIITGSNMAGKSTFLRTVGCNVVLSLLGSPVCARELVVSPTRVFTSMRTEDNLEENVSSFYAELKRLKQLINLVDQGNPVLFMLDEILKGTNSKDRHIGAAALIKQLRKGNASGFVSTHDVELGNLDTALPDLKNFSFNSYIIDDEINFDYKLHRGVCKGFNASKLMEKMGIAIHSQD